MRFNVNFAYLFSRDRDYGNPFFTALNNRFFQFIQNHCRFFGHTVKKLMITFFMFKMFAGKIQSSQNQHCFSIDLTRISVKLRLDFLNGILKECCHLFRIGYTGFCLKGEFATSICNVTVFSNSRPFLIITAGHTFIPLKSPLIFQSGYQFSF